MTWFDLHDLPEAHPFLLGVLELDPLGGVTLELHLVRPAPGAPCRGAWFDERGRRWRLVEAARALRARTPPRGCGIGRGVVTSSPSEPPPPLLLVVHDDDANRYLLARHLRKGGFRVLEAADGRQGLELARRERPEVVLLDVGLPGLSGHEVGRALRADPATAGLGIIYVSAHYDPAPALASGGGDAFLAQPADEGALLATVRLVLRTRREAGAGGPGPGV